MEKGEYLNKGLNISRFKNVGLIGFIYILVNMRIYYVGINLVINRVKRIGHFGEIVRSVKVDYVIEVGNIIFDKNYINACLLIFLAYILIKGRGKEKDGIALKLLIGFGWMFISFLVNMAITWAVYVSYIGELQSYGMLYNLLKSIALDFIINVALLYIFMFIHSFYRNGFIAGVVSWAFTINIESSFYILYKSGILKGGSKLSNYISYLDISKYNWHIFKQMPVALENLGVKILILGFIIALSIVVNYFAYNFNTNRAQDDNKNKAWDKFLIAFLVIGFIFLAVDMIRPSVEQMIYYCAEWDLIFIICAVAFYFGIPKVIEKIKRVE